MALAEQEKIAPRSSSGCFMRDGGTEKGYLAFNEILISACMEHWKELGRKLPQPFLS
jgi:hypothetical protein